MLEKQLENYIVDHIGDGIFSGFGNQITIVGRQVQLPHGIVDLLLFNGESFWVTELKAVSVKPRDYTQVMRYTQDIKEIIANLGTKWAMQPDSDECSNFIEATRWFWYTEESVIPVLVGPSCPENVRFVMRKSNGIVFRFDSKQAPTRFTEYTFEPDKKLPDPDVEEIIRLTIFNQAALDAKTMEEPF